MSRILFYLVLSWSFVLNATVTTTPAAGPSGNGLGGRAVSGSAPSDTNVMAWNATDSQWEPAAGGGGGSSTPTANTVAKWDASKQMSADNFIFSNASTGTLQTPNVAGVTQGVSVVTGNNTKASGADATGALVLSTGSVTGGATGASADVSVITGTSTTGGNTGSIILQPGTAGGGGGTVGKIRFDTQTANSVGDVWTATSTNGEGHYAAAAAGGTTYIANQYGVALSSATNATLTILAPNASTNFPLVSGGASANPSWKLLPVAGGGTGLATLTAHTLQVGNGASTPTQLALDASTGKTLHSGGSSADPTWALTTLTSDVTGVLPVANGGTNSATVVSAPAASAWAGWNANSNLSANSFIPGYATTATASQTTTLTVASAGQQFFTGTTAGQIVQMPDVSTLVLGQSWYIVNNSNQSIAVKSSGSNTIQTMAASTSATFTTILTSGTGTASWSVSYNAQGAAGTTYTANQYGVALSSATNATLTVLAPDASTTKILTSGGASANPTWTAPAYPTLTYLTNGTAIGGYAGGIAGTFLTMGQVALTQGTWLISAKSEYFNPSAKANLFQLCVSTTTNACASGTHGQNLLSMTVPTTGLWNNNEISGYAVTVASGTTTYYVTTNLDTDVTGAQVGTYINALKIAP